MNFKQRAVAKFQNTRQAALEKMGKTENTTEPENMRLQTAVLERHNSALQRSSKAIGKQAKSLGTVAEDGMGIADAVAEASGAAKSAGGAAPEYIELTEQLATFHVGLEDLRLTLLAQTSEAADTLRALTKAEIKQARAAKNKYAKVRLAYEAQRAKVAKLRAAQKNTKADEAQKESDELRARFEDAGRDTLDVIETANIVSEYETVSQLAGYLEAYAEFVAKSHAWLAESAPLIAKSRAFVEQRRLEVQQREQAAAAQASRGRVFGESLDVLVERDGTPIPKVVSALVAYLEQHALAEEGLFRVTGFKSEVASLRSRAEADDNFAIGDAPNLVHEVASLFKAFLRDLPEPLFTHALYDSFVQLADADHATRLSSCRELFAKLPPSHAALVECLLKLMHTVAAHSDQNKMSPSNLSIVMSPNVLVASHSDPMRMVKESVSCSAVFEWMIASYGELFDDAAAAALSASGAAAASSSSSSSLSPSSLSTRPRVSMASSAVARPIPPTPARARPATPSDKPPSVATNMNNNDDDDDSEEPPMPSTAPPSAGQTSSLNDDLDELDALLQ